MIESMKLNTLRLPIILTILTMTVGILVLGIHIGILTQQNSSQGKNSMENNKLDIQELNEELVDLKEEYFDDLNPVWGRLNENDELIGEAFESKYVAQSLPKPITHPIEISQDKIIIESVKRSEIKPPFGIPEGPNKGDFNTEELRAIDNNYSQYGELFGSYFSSKGEEIYSIENADTDKDGKPEKLIITGQIGGNHPPNNGYIVKNNVIIATTHFAAGSIYPVRDGNGFFVKEPDYSDAPMCCPNRVRIYRIVFENDKFVPIWEQDVAYLRFKR